MAVMEDAVGSFWVTSLAPHIVEDFGQAADKLNHDLSYRGEGVDYLNSMMGFTVADYVDGRGICEQPGVYTTSFAAKKLVHAWVQHLRAPPYYSIKQYHLGQG